uniref:YTH domain-containing protein n=1 Tax=Caenorhabditis tropicalis TaxID=1561998 RepID=A0A1I7U3M8_9PELO
MDPMRDLSVSDSRSDSSSSPPLPPSSLPTAATTAQTFWAHNLGDTSFQFGSMMYPLTSQMSSTNNSTVTTPLQPSSSNPFDFSSATAAQQHYLYQTAAGYNPWTYPAAYSFPSAAAYQYTTDQDFKS